MQEFLSPGGSPVKGHKIKQAISEYSKALKNRLNTNLIEVRLFGSVAKGTYNSESDIDILVLVINDDKRTREAVIDVAVDVNLQYDVVISPIVVNSAHFSAPLFRETLFYKSIQEEGVLI